MRIRQAGHAGLRAVHTRPQISRDGHLRIPPDEFHQLVLDSDDVRSGDAGAIGDQMWVSTAMVVRTY
jgi:hypothetical protein